MTQDGLHDAADKIEIMDLSANYMRGLDRLDGELERSVFWDDAFCSYGIYEGGPDGFVEYCQKALVSHASNHHFIGQVNIELDGDEAFGEVYYQAFHRVRNADDEDRDLAGLGWVGRVGAEGVAQALEVKADDDAINRCAVAIK